MPNEKSKQKVQVWMDPALVAQIDGMAAKDGISRAAVITDAVKSYLSGNDADTARLETIIAKLDGLANGQDTIKAAQTTNVTLLADAIRNQPIAAQEIRQQELPSPEPEKRGFFAKFFS